MRVLAGIRVEVSRDGYRQLRLVTRSLNPTGRGRARWPCAGNAALNAFAITFERRIVRPQPVEPARPVTPNVGQSRPRAAFWVTRGAERRFRIPMLTATVGQAGSIAASFQAASKKPSSNRNARR
jgi:hypothetical protein